MVAKVYVLQSYAQISAIKGLKELADSLDPLWVMACHSHQLLSLLDVLERKYSAFTASALNATE
jgi:hypothetical protein